VPEQNEVQYIPRVVGNREPIGFTLLKVDGEVASSLSGKTFTVRKAATPGGVVADSTGPVTLIDATTGELSWTPSEADVATAGRFALYVVDNSSQPRRWPYEGPNLILDLVAESG
jgi:fermentation-respiration switch protein FrsA (DUF1100 family)